MATYSKYSLPEKSMDDEPGGHSPKCLKESGCGWAQAQQY